MTTRRHLIVSLYLPNLLIATAQGALVPILPLYAQSFGVSFGLVSLAVAALGLGTLAADLPVGALLDRLGRRTAMLIGAGGYAAACLALGLAGSYPEIVVNQLVAGAATAMWNISRLAYITDSIPVADRGRVLATFGGLIRIGGLIGPALGGLVADRLGLPAACLAAGLLGVGATALALLFAHEPRVARFDRRAVRWHVLLGLLTTRRHALLTAGSAQLWLQMIRAGRQIIIPLYAATALGLDIAAIGWVVSLSWACEVALFIPAGLIMDRLGRKYTVVPSSILLALGMALVPLAQSVAGLVAAIIVMGIGNGLGAGSMMTLGADLSPRQATGEFLGIWRLIGDTGVSGGPLVVGIVADLLGLGLAALALAGVGLLAAGTVALFVDETLARDESLERLNV